MQILEQEDETGNARKLTHNRMIPSEEDKVFFFFFCGIGTEIIPASRRVKYLRECKCGYNSSNLFS